MSEPVLCTCGHRKLQHQFCSGGISLSVPEGRCLIEECECRQFTEEHAKSVSNARQAVIDAANKLVEQHRREPKESWIGWYGLVDAVDALNKLRNPPGEQPAERTKRELLVCCSCRHEIMPGPRARDGYYYCTHCWPDDRSAAEVVKSEALEALKANTMEKPTFEERPKVTQGGGRTRSD